MSSTDFRYEVRFNGLEKALSSFVTSGLKAGWTGLGHNQSEVLNLIGELPGQPFAMRRKDGSERVEQESEVGELPAEAETS